MAYERETIGGDPDDTRPLEDDADLGSVPPWLNHITDPSDVSPWHRAWSTIESEMQDQGRDQFATLQQQPAATSSVITAGFHTLPYLDTARIANSPAASVSGSPVSSQDLLDGALLAFAAYSGTSNAVQSALLETGWHALSANDLNLSTSYFDGNDGATSCLFQYFNAEGFIAQKGNTLAISFAGTNDLSDLWNDLEGSIGGFDTYFYEFRALTSALMQHIESNGVSHVIVAGHSLGAAAVEIFMHDHIADQRFVALTFGSPGEFTLPNQVGSDARIWNFGNTGDPVYNVASASGQGIDVSVDLPGTQNLYGIPGLAVLLENAGAFSFEHDPLLYTANAYAIAYSHFFEEFSEHPAAFQVVIDNAGISTFSLSTASFLLAGVGGDTVHGSAATDLIEGGSGADTIYGGAGNDKIDGGRDDDVIRGGSGNDTIYGGTGYDTALFDQNFDHYVIQYHQLSGSEWVTVAPQSWALQSEGTDTVYQVENFSFADGSYSWQQIVNAANGGGDAGSGGGGTISDPGSDATDIPGNTTTPNTAIVIPGTSSTQGIAFNSTIGFTGDKDYVRIYMQEGSTYRIHVSGNAFDNMAALSDTFFRIRDGRDTSALNPAPLPPTGQDSYDQAVGNDAQLDFVAPYTGLYFISVGAGGANFASLTGGYQLTAVLIGTPATNHNPVANGDTFKAQFGQTVSGNVLANDTDQDQSHSALGADPINGTHTALGGTVTLLADGTLQYAAPASGSPQNDSFNYIVRDGDGGSATGIVTIQLHQPDITLPAFTDGSDIVTLPDARGPFYGQGGNDVFTITAPTGSTVFGGEGDDTFKILGGAEHDLIGGPGSDLFIAGPGSAECWGDEVGSDYGSIDTVDFSAATAGLNIDERSGDSVSGSGIGATRIADIENVIGTAYRDTIVGTDSNNQIWAGDGDDYVIAYGGDDVIYGGNGDDTLAGDSTLADNVGNDRVYGEAGNDTLRGYAGDDLLDGGAGNDTLLGGAGNDVLNGGTGDDGVFGENGNDYIIASAGNDRVRGMGGIDTIDFSQAPGPITGGFTQGGSISVAGWGTSSIEELENIIATPFDDNFSVATAGAIVHLGQGDDFLTAQMSGQFFGEDGSDHIFLIDGGTSYGGAGDDVLNASSSSAVGVKVYGQDGNDYLSATSNDDNLDGGSGNDSIHPGAGNDAVYGGDGDDSIYMAGGLSAADHIDGGTGIDQVYLTGDYATTPLVFGPTTMLNVEYLTVTAGYSYNLTTNDATVAAGQTLTVNGQALGSSNALSFDGFAETDGNFIIYGGSGTDTVTGGSGDDVFVYTDGALDTFDGGSGNNTLDLSQSTSAIWFGFSDPSGIEAWTKGNSDISQPGTWRAIVDTSHVENVIGTAYNDQITGDANNNVYGYTGGFDTFDGGSGTNTLDLSQSTSAIWFGFSDPSGIEAWTKSNSDISQPGTWRAIVDTSHVENVIGTAYNDQISGDANNNVYGYTGGFDTFDGGSGTNTLDLSQSTSAIWFGFSDPSGIEAWTKGNSDISQPGTWRAIVDTSHVENVIGTAYNDQISGDANNNVLSGGDGSDTIAGGGGGDTFVYNSVADSTGIAHDMIVGFDAANDRFDFSFSVTGVDTVVDRGNLSVASFDADLTSAVGAAHLSAHHAVLFNPISGDQTGHSFLIVDANGIAGYQAGQDFVIELSNPTHIASLSTADFI